MTNKKKKNNNFNFCGKVLIYTLFGSTNVYPFRKKKKKKKWHANNSH